MKITFQTAYAAPVKSGFAHANAANPSMFSNPVKFSVKNDSFVKSPVAFGSDKMQESPVVVTGSYGIIKNLANFARTCSCANHGRKMPAHSDFDNTMRGFFPLCVSSVSTYTDDEGVLRFPSEDEFKEILVKLWNESKKLDGADESEYFTEKITKLKEEGRMPYIRRYVEDDIGRAMDVFALERYGHRVENEDDVKHLASELYDDATVRTLNDVIGQVTVANGGESKYREMLELCYDSKSRLEFLFEHEDMFFAPPKSLRARYKEDVQRRQAELQRQSGNNYEDKRTDAEKAIDQANGWG